MRPEDTEIDGRIRVVLADDGGWLRSLMASGLRDAGFDVVAEATDLDTAIAAVRRHQPDVAVFDVRMPPTCTNEGIIAAKALQTEGWEGSSVLISSQIHVAIAADLIDSFDGGIGYLHKDHISGSGWELADAIRRVHDGDPVIDPTIIQQLLKRPRRNNPLDSLTPTQFQVLSLVAEGLSNVGVAKRMHVSPRTVEAHVSAVFDLLRLERTTEGHRRVAATLIYLRHLG